MSPVISTERLILRGPMITDAPRIAEIAGDFNVAAMTTSMPHPYGLGDAEEWIGKCRHLDWRHEAMFVVEHRAFGVVGLMGFDRKRGSGTEIGYALGRPFWSRGYATEAARAALRWAKRDWGRKVVVAGHFADNPASGQVLVKAGFLYTGDVEMRACTARDGELVPTRLMVWLA
ncbi:GNAT family N-acetyltransferase [Phenylobacterium sp.]|uniref:GNAT family N-acetyltransferase n=1 Tax=Phenylobacterium sp. TaxID=1871053 RepID=UPI002F42E763